MTGFFTIPADQYHRETFGEPDGQPFLSSGIARAIIDCSPLHAWHAHPRLNPDWKPVDDARFDLGTAVHRLLLEGIDAYNGSVVVVPADDWRKKDAKETREEAHAVGLTPLLERDYVRVIEMNAAVCKQLQTFGLQPEPFTDGRPEVTIVWHEPGGTACKARIDWLHTDGSISDFKSTSASANPEQWTRNTLYRIGADMQVAFYSLGIERLTGRRPEWRYVIAETYPPYALSVVMLTPAVLEIAERKVERAIELWSECLKSGRWPGYQNRVCWAELPAWQETQWLEREAREELAA